jgi:hypothetical protein
MRTIDRLRPRGYLPLVVGLLVLLAAPAPRADAANLGTLTVVGSSGERYRWSRNGLTISLLDRHGKWTEQEAVWVRDALDLLPDLYIKKAIAGGLQKIHRDGLHPDAPWQFIEPVGETIKAVAVPPAPWNYVAVCDQMFSSPEKVRQVITHELGHCVHWSLGGFGITTGTPAAWSSISWTGAGYVGLKSWNGFVTSYSRGNLREDFADCAKFYWLAPDLLARKNPAKFAYMRDVVFERLVSPPAARLPLQLVDDVEPVISSLGDTAEPAGGAIKVHGSYFMAPTDGGFDTVRFRGTAALHLAVSRKQVIAYVPAIGSGSAPVTVTTQDGKSNAAAFTVKKPWWHFW